jgi:hypothetical protein
MKVTGNITYCSILRIRAIIILRVTFWHFSDHPCDFYIHLTFNHSTVKLIKKVVLKALSCSE